MKCPVLGFDGKVKKQIEVASEIFDTPFRGDVLHRAIVYQAAKRQTGHHQTKTIGYVSGGGKKPHRQKGTGRARQGSSRSGHMRGGACTFGPQVRSHAISLPKKLFLLSIKVAISQRFRENRLVVVEDELFKDASTKMGVQLLENLKIRGGVLVVAESSSVAMRKSLRNIPRTTIVPPGAINTYDVVKLPFLLLTEGALLPIVEKMHQKSSPAVAGDAGQVAGKRKLAGVEREATKSSSMNKSEGVKSGS